MYFNIWTMNKKIKFYKIRNTSKSQESKRHGICITTICIWHTFIVSQYNRKSFRRKYLQIFRSLFSYRIIFQCYCSKSNKRGNKNTRKRISAHLGASLFVVIAMFPFWMIVVKRRHFLWRWYFANNDLQCHVTHKLWLSLWCDIIFFQI